LSASTLFSRTKNVTTCKEREREIWRKKKGLSELIFFFSLHKSCRDLNTEKLMNKYSSYEDLPSFFRFYHRMNLFSLQFITREHSSSCFISWKIKKYFIFMSKRNIQSGYCCLFSNDVCWMHHKNWQFWVRQL
jgi:hypothetical protein